MRRFLLQMALILLAGGWCATTRAAWDTTNRTPITKAAGLRDGMYVYFRNQCNLTASEMVLGSDFSYGNVDMIAGNHIFLLKDGGTSPLTGDPMYYVQNVESELWYSGTDRGWTVEAMDESTPITFCRASQWTSMEIADPASPGEWTSLTGTEWVAAGGDLAMPEEEMFPASYKIPTWKWRPSELGATDGDALVLAHFDEDVYVPGTFMTEGFYCIYQIWGAALGYKTAGIGSGRTGINPWYAYEATYVDDPIGDLEGLVAMYRTDNHQHYFRKGIDPGCLVDGSLYDKFESNYQEAVNLLNGDNLTAEGAAVLRDALKASRKELDKAPLIPMTEGFYYITSAMWEFGEKQTFEVNQDGQGDIVTVGKVMGIYDKESDVASWNVANELLTTESGAQQVVMKRNASYVFHITPSKTQPGAWDIRNAETGRYLNGLGEGSAMIPSSLKAETPQQITIVPGRGSFVFGAYGVGGTGFYAPAGHGNGGGTGGVLTGWLASDPVTAWNFMTVADKAFTDSLKALLPQKTIEAELGQEIAVAESAVSTGYLSLLTNEGQLSSNAVDPGEGSLAALIDNNTSTYFCSSWHADVDPGEDHYVQANLPEAVNRIALYWHRRMQNTANRPAKITVMGLADGSWEQAGILPVEGDTLPWGKATPAFIKEMSFDKYYTALRFVVNETTDAGGNINTAMNNGHPFFTVSEIQLYNGLNPDSTFIYRSASMAYRADMKDAFAALSAALDAARLKVGQASQADVDALRAANEAFSLIYPDTTILDEVLERARTFYDEAIPSDGDTGLMGAYNTEEVHEALGEAVNQTLKAYDKENVTRAFINEQAQLLQAAIDRFVADVNMPRFDTWYHIVNLCQDEEMEEENNPFGTYVHAGGMSVADGLRWGGTVSEAESDPAYLWRFVDMGNGTFAVQNLGSGYYMGANRGTSKQYLLSDTAVAFRFAYVAGEQLTLEDVAYPTTTSGQRTYRYMTAEPGGAVVTWEAFKDSPASWTFREVEDGTFVAHKTLEPKSRNIYCFPYTTAAAGGLSTVYGTEVKVYTLANATTDAEGMVSELTFNPMDVPVGGIPAGVPYLVEVPDEVNDENGMCVVDFSLDASAALNTVAGINNGLVGTLTRDTIRTDGMGYFTGDETVLRKAIAGKTVINSQYGYINPKLITPQAATEGSIVVTIKNGGVLDHISQSVTDADAPVTVTSLAGVVLRSGVKPADALKGLPRGIYVVNGRKVLVK